MAVCMRLLGLDNTKVGGAAQPCLEYNGCMNWRQTATFWKEKEKERVGWPTVMAYLHLDIDNVNN